MGQRVPVKGQTATIAGFVGPVAFVTTSEHSYYSSDRAADEVGMSGCGCFHYKLIYVNGCWLELAAGRPLWPPATECQAHIPKY